MRSSAKRIPFEHAMVTNANCSELQHSRAVLGNNNAAPAEYVGQAALVYALRL